MCMAKRLPPSLVNLHSPSEGMPTGISILALCIAATFRKIHDVFGGSSHASNCLPADNHN